jgi:hypothetical protein
LALALLVLALGHWHWHSLVFKLLLLLVHHVVLESLPVAGSGVRLIMPVKSRFKHTASGPVAQLHT